MSMGSGIALGIASGIASGIDRPMRRGLRGAAYASMIALAAGLGLGACTGHSGTISVELVTAPESMLFDQISRGRLTLTDPLTVVESTREEGPPVLDMEVVASGGSAALIFEGFDDSGELIAYGRSGAIPIAAISGRLRLYVGPPLGITAAPVLLSEATGGRTDLAVAATPDGVVIAGGRGRDGQAVAEVLIYNLYEHDLIPLAPIGSSGAADDEGQPRADMTAVSAGRVVYLFGGEDANGMVSAAGWSLNTEVPPRGTYISLDAATSAARAGASAAVAGNTEIVITGDPLLVLNTFTRQIAPLQAGGESAPAASGTATAFVQQDSQAVLFAGRGNGDSGALVLAGGELSSLEAPAAWARTGHAAPALPDGTVLVIGGEGEGELLSSAVRYDPLAMEFAVLDDVLATPRRNAAVAATAAYLVVAGGEDAGGQAIGDAEIFSLPSLERIDRIPLLVPRTGADAVALANGQVLIVGGEGENGEPSSVIELFTPDRQ